MDAKKLAEIKARHERVRIKGWPTPNGGLEAHADRGLLLEVLTQARGLLQRARPEPPISWTESADTSKLRAEIDAFLAGLPPVPRATEEDVKRLAHEAFGMASAMVPLQKWRMWIGGILAGLPTTDPADRWIAWRGSVSDLATDIRKALSSEQTYRLFCNLGEGKDAPRTWTEEQIREAYPHVRVLRGEP